MSKKENKQSIYSMQDDLELITKTVNTFIKDKILLSSIIWAAFNKIKTNKKISITEAINESIKEWNT